MSTSADRIKLGEAVLAVIDKGARKPAMSS